MEGGHLGRNVKDKKGFEGQSKGGRTLRTREQCEQSRGKVEVHGWLGSAACVERGGECVGSPGTGLERHSKESEGPGQGHQREVTLDLCPRDFANQDCVNIDWVSGSHDLKSPFITGLPQVSQFEFTCVTNHLHKAVLK